jgi:AcrR family transcriptional regulator
VRSGIKPVLQKRAEMTRDKLVAAFETLLRDKPFDEITVAEIAKGAGMSVGAVYRRFENKDAFIPVIFDIYAARLLASMGEGEGLEIEPDEGLRSAMRMIARAGWELGVAEAPIIRAAHLYARLRPDLVGAEWDALLRANTASYRQMLEHFPEVKRRDLDAAAQMLAYFFNTALTEKAIYPTEGPAAQMTVDGLDFADAIADFAYGYLTTPEE